MQKPLLPSNEIQRLEALRRYELLDTPSEQEFDDLARLAGFICDSPIALVSLVDKNRQWFKARVGLEAEETEREIAFCAHAIHSHDVFVVENALEDPRFFDNPLVLGAPNIRFYAGAPLITPDGYSLGTLCAIDSKPHVLTPEQSQNLLALSRQVVRQMELRLINRQLKEQNDDKIRLFSTLSHDLRTPFNGLLGYSDMLSKKADVMDRERIAVISKNMSLAAHSAFEQLESVLDWCQSQLNAVHCEKIPVQLSPLFAEIRALMHQKISEKMLRFDIKVKDEFYVLTDSALLRSIIQNLVTNALKFTPEQGLVSLAAEPVAPSQLRISVTDSGIGLSEEQIAELLARGRMASHAGTRGEKGTGLGLMLCNDHLKRLESSLKVTSELGQGSCFSFDLALA